MEKINFVEEIRRFVERECKKSNSKYGQEPYYFHFVPMHEYSVKLAQELGADIEVVELAAWFHDIGSIVYGRNNHHITGAEIAKEKLEEYGYDKIKEVEHCIITHRSSNGFKPESLEAKIIADADALANFDNIAGIFKAAFIYEGLDQGQAVNSVRNKLERKWIKLQFQESRKIIEPKYNAAMLLLK